VFVRTGPSTALGVENRQRVGNDFRICHAGLLVYSVDARVRTGTRPIRVIGGSTGAGCGYGSRSDAPLHAGEKVRVGGVTVTAQAGRGQSLVAVVTRS
jgi:hypothetical protein